MRLGERSGGGVMSGDDWGTLEGTRLGLESNGFREIEHAPRNPLIKTGARVRNAGEQYQAAVNHGTATVVAVMRRGSDERPDSWELSWGRPNVEVIVERDPARVSFGSPKYTTWADYGTALALDCEVS